MLAARGMEVVAIEPNDAMRANELRTEQHNVRWHEGTGEETGQEKIIRNGYLWQFV